MKADKTWEEYKSKAQDCHGTMTLLLTIIGFDLPSCTVVVWGGEHLNLENGVKVSYSEIENSFKDPCNPEKIELDCWKLQYGFDWIFDEDIKT